MNSTKIKKTIIKLLPYIILGLACTNLGEAWRLAEGADMGKKMLSFFSMVGAAFGNPEPAPFRPACGNDLWRWAASCSLPPGQEC